MIRSYLILPLLLIFSLSAQAAQELDRIVALVDNDVILKSELDEALLEARQNLLSRKLSLPPEKVLQQQVLNSLIIKRLQLTRAEQMKISIDDASLNNALQNYARGVGLQSLRDLQQRQALRGIAWDSFREQFREEMLISQLQQRVLRPLVNVSEQEVDSYLASMQTQGQVNVEYRWSHILLATPQAAKSQQIQAVKSQADKLRQELQAGADFAAAAVRLSKGRNALQGGDMGWSSVGQLPTLFNNVLPQMKEGEISQVLRSPSGFHIIKLVQIRSSSQGLSLNPAQLRERARDLLGKRKFQEQLEQWLLQTRDSAYVEIRL